MKSETMTVHKALCELKLLDSRIKKEIGESTFVFANKHSNTKVKGVDIGVFQDEIKSKFQSITDLINRRNAIKRAVVLSNAITKVTVCGIEYTVVEAIDMKQTGTETKKYLIQKIAIDNSRARSDCFSNNENGLEERANTYIANLYGSTDMKNTSKDAQEAYNRFVEAQTYEVVDPIGAVDVIAKLDKEINDFMTDVDAALSVSNAITTITIEY